MRFKFLVTAMVAALTLTACGGDADAATQTDPVPEWAVPCPVNSESVEAEDFTDINLPCLGTGNDYTVGLTGGKPLVLTLWASWCAPCAAEAPAVQEFHELLGDRVSVVGVNNQDDHDKALYFAEEFGWTFPSVYDERGEVLRSQGLVTLPVIFFIDAEGATQGTLMDSDLTTDDLLAAADEHFGITP
ncbi:thiol-disulfide isomerase/thioredoxin [Stackebrandtia albiflava]|uniref:Thiol-disulfide isomerase/thioredoxin n=1 Tax=Stackebrandtia albiflava TaxID=406432 RepID=A0A562UY61_9ACTN|nr:TlpA disulfide reductase family protein [Stackebrandtia albiflava]TWJ10584.1 thiol-disulfide isomerase/thioredoxin [Stackebrandtia albiflava]